jgi:hypothetical protein
MADEYTGDIPRLKVRHALVPITAVVCFLLGLATTLREPAPTLAINEVVTMKPVEGSDGQPVFPKMPIEALYGVPSERTQHLWSPHKKPASEADKQSEPAEPSET